ncbi:putative lipo domain protein, partial [Vibrio parahaemolyticus SBR10290]
LHDTTWSVVLCFRVFSRYFSISNRYHRNPCRWKSL